MRLRYKQAGALTWRIFWTSGIEIITSLRSDPDAALLALMFVVQAVGSSRMSAAAWCCTTKLENTHGPEIRELLYPWHPWFGLRVAVHEAIVKSDGVVFRCSLSGSEGGRWLEIPAWMFDRSACARVNVGTDAHADLAALTTLGGLLRQVLNNRFASSYIRLSGASILSRDQNRGEVHATPDEADDGAPPRAATNRPVHRRTADGHPRHARMVRAADTNASSTDRPDDTVDPGACRQEPDR